MTNDIGPQYSLDDSFKAAARLHQSSYRAEVLKVNYEEYGNRLQEADGSALLNYYEALGVREALRRRYPGYSRKRDADLLRSEHIPFNLLAPLAERPDLMKAVLAEAFELELDGPFEVKFEWAPGPASNYLGDMTSFDTYVQGVSANGERVGIGIEVKYTEQGYRIGKSEAKRVADQQSTYWIATRECGLFVESGCEEVTEDRLRQIWRNHLLGLSMVKRQDIERFVSVTLYPGGNKHFASALDSYQQRLLATGRGTVRGCTYERYINALRGSSEIEAWKAFLIKRYLIAPRARRS
jgi:hypothetical protein